jgi:hypothetical protein
MRAKGKWGSNLATGVAVAAAIALALLTACSSDSTSGPTTQPDPTLPTSQSIPTAVGPKEQVDLRTFEGYGDYSGLSYHEVDWLEIMDKAVQCANDHGFPVRLTYDGGADFQDVPAAQNQEASFALDYCLQAMNVPNWSWPTEQQIREKYQYALALVPCIRALGYEVDDPPTVETYIETWQTRPWTPFSHVPPGAEAVFRNCPPSPVGGPAAWQTGDAITPVPDAYGDR